MKLIWLAIAIGFAIAEMMTATVTLIWFSISAIILIFLSSFIESIMLQIIIFGVISTILLITATKKIIKKNDTYNYHTNLQGILNERGLVKVEILPKQTGIVVVMGEEWSAISFDEEKIEVGTYVKILKIEGVKLVVEKYREVE